MTAFRSWLADRMVAFAQWIRPLEPRNAYQENYANEFIAGFESRDRRIL